MADLLDRVSGLTDRPHIRPLRFLGTQRLYAMGEWNRVEIAAEWDLQGDELSQATALADKIDSLSGLQEKLLYLARVEAVLMCVSDGRDGLYHTESRAVDKAKVYEDLLFI